MGYYISSLKMAQVLNGNGYNSYFKFWGVKEDFISTVWQMELVNVVIKCWTIDHYTDGIFGCSSKVLVLHLHYTNVLHILGWKVMLQCSHMGEEALKCSLNQYANDLADHQCILYDFLSCHCCICK